MHLARSGRHGGVSALDVLLALVLTGLALAEIWGEPIFQTGIPGPPVALSVLLVAAGGFLLLRSRWALGALVGFAVCGVLVAAVGDQDQAAFEFALGTMLTTYAVAAAEPLGRATVGLGVAVAAGASTSWLTYVDADTPADVAVPLLLLGAAWAVGREVRHAREHAAETETTARAATLANRAEVATSAMEERTRIARELHDVVAHGVSVMGLRAAGTRARLPEDREQEREALRGIEELGRSTLDELHRMLGVLRSTSADLPEADLPETDLPEGDTGPPLGPAPRLDGLPELCAATQQPEARLEVHGEARPLPAGTELSAYRIVQEGLTNARRHSGAAHVWVDLTYEPDGLRVEVRDDGGSAPARVVRGHGLRGVQERVSMLGGSLELGACDGGFRMLAVLPVAGR